MNKKPLLLFQLLGIIELLTTFAWSIYASILTEIVILPEVRPLTPEQPCLIWLTVGIMAIATSLDLGNSVQLIKATTFVRMEIL